MKTINGDTAISIAKIRGYKKIYDLLKKLGAKE